MRRTDLTRWALLEDSICVICIAIICAALFIGAAALEPLPRVLPGAAEKAAGGFVSPAPRSLSEGERI